jgi:hypothetical protein
MTVTPFTDTWQIRTEPWMQRLGQMNQMMIDFTHTPIQMGTNPKRQRGE